MSEATKKRPRLVWHREQIEPDAPHWKQVQRGYDLWLRSGDTSRRVAEVRYAPRPARTYYFTAEGGRDSLLAGEKFKSMGDAKTACGTWIKTEIKCRRM